MIGFPYNEASSPPPPLSSRHRQRFKRGREVLAEVSVFIISSSSSKARCRPMSSRAKPFVLSRSSNSREARNLLFSASLSNHGVFFRPAAPRQSHPPLDCFLSSPCNLKVTSIIKLHRVFSFSAIPTAHFSLSPSPS